MYAVIINRENMLKGEYVWHNDRAHHQVIFSTLACSRSISVSPLSPWACLNVHTNKSTNMPTKKSIVVCHRRWRDEYIRCTLMESVCLYHHSDVMFLKSGTVVKCFNQFSIRITWSVRAWVGYRPGPKNNTESNLNYGSKRLGVCNPLNKQGKKVSMKKKKLRWGVELPPADTIW